ncbi:Minor extracellular protease Epr precursor [Paenibacillus sp. GM2FR]|uniref:S8 family peptidase n=1 Tax=Paenibacillus sp. GM2FR TaxID=2059268 RepID=UPI000CAFAC4C|nr:S8 family peptidase [Paenibacillus sp. GM2FR]PJN51241.1 Minor extracellular protease Epr precursor [Paenibacillus sp. GM2FR]
MINTEAFWSSGITGEGINIAILDSGIYADHFDFGPQMKEGVNFVNKGQPPIDYGGHGTLVAGIISAKHNNLGIDGIAPSANVYPLKVLDKWGNGNTAHIIEAIDWCIEHKIDIINMSFAMDQNSPKLERAIRKALDANIIVVAAAMNSYGGDVGYPAAYDGVISVNAINYKKKLSKTGPHGKIDFSAPGVDVLSTSIDNDLSFVSGTSIAAPHITGIIALLLQKDISNKSDIYNELQAYAIDLGDKGKDPYFGEGTISLINK